MISYFVILNQRFFTHNAHRRYLIIVICTLLTFTFTLWSQNLPKNTRYINIKFGVTLKGSPTTSGKKISEIPYGEKVFILEKSGGELITMWYKIKWKRKVGWVNSSFLTEKKISKKLEEIVVKNMEASSELDAEHNVRVINDSVYGTAWTDKNRNKSGVGEWVKFNFRKLVIIKEIAIINGLGITEGEKGNLYYKYASIKKAAIRYSNGSEEVVYFRQTPNWQKVKLKYANGVDWLELKIEREFPGSVYKDSYISEIMFYGY